MKALLFTIALFVALESCKSKPDLEKDLPMIVQGDSICNVPGFGIIRGVRLLDSQTTQDNDTVIVKIFLKAVAMKDTPTGVWFAGENQMIKKVYINGMLAMTSTGKPQGYDSIRLQSLLKK